MDDVFDPNADSEEGSGDEIDGEYEVERILADKTLEDGTHQYEIKWKGYDEITWEPEESLTGCPDKLREYNRKKSREKMNRRKSNLPGNKKKRPLSRELSSSTKRRSKSPTIPAAPAASSSSVHFIEQLCPEEPKKNSQLRNPKLSGASVSKSPKDAPVASSSSVVCLDPAPATKSTNENQTPKSRNGGSRKSIRKSHKPSSIRQNLPPNEEKSEESVGPILRPILNSLSEQSANAPVSGTEEALKGGVENPAEKPSRKDTMEPPPMGQFPEETLRSLVSPFEGASVSSTDDGGMKEPVVSSLKNSSTTASTLHRAVGPGVRASTSSSSKEERKIVENTVSSLASAAAANASEISTRIQPIPTASNSQNQPLSHCGNPESNQYGIDVQDSTVPTVGDEPKPTRPSLGADIRAAMFPLDPIFSVEGETSHHRVLPNLSHPCLVRSGSGITNMAISHSQSHAAFTQSPMDTATPSYGNSRISPKFQTRTVSPDPDDESQTLQALESQMMEESMRLETEPSIADDEVPLSQPSTPQPASQEPPMSPLETDREEIDRIPEEEGSEKSVGLEPMEPENQGVESNLVASGPNSVEADWCEDWRKVPSPDMSVSPEAASIISSASGNLNDTGLGESEDGVSPNPSEIMLRNVVMECFSELGGEVWEENVYPLPVADLPHDVLLEYRSFHTKGPAYAEAWEKRLRQDIADTASTYFERLRSAAKLGDFDCFHDLWNEIEGSDLDSRPIGTVIQDSEEKDNLYGMTLAMHCAWKRPGVMRCTNADNHGWCRILSFMGEQLHPAYMNKTSREEKFTALLVSIRSGAPCQTIALIQSGSNLSNPSLTQEAILRKDIDRLRLLVSAGAYRLEEKDVPIEINIYKQVDWIKRHFESLDECFQKWNSNTSEDFKSSTPLSHVETYAATDVLETGVIKVSMRLSKRSSVLQREKEYCVLMINVGKYLMGEGGLLSAKRVKALRKLPRIESVKKRSEELIRLTPDDDELIFSEAPLMSVYAFVPSVEDTNTFEIALSNVSGANQRQRLVLFVQAWKVALT